MAYKIQWDDDAKTIIICTLERDFSLLNHITTVFSEFDELADTVEHKVGVIIDWTGFRPFVSDSNPDETETAGRRGNLRGDFGSPGHINLIGMKQKENPPPPKITIMVFVFPESIAENFKNAVSTMMAVSTSQTQFNVAPSVEKAREIISSHFQ